MVLPINITLLIELVAVVIVSAAFLFYWNRLGAWFLALIIRLVYRYKWKQRLYITCGSIQISLLAGRITFRDLEYHGSNISFRALHGHITWRYWKFRTIHNEDVDSNNLSRKSLPCKIRVHAEGVEIFIYNRTPAYDEIVRRMQKHEAEKNGEGLKTPGTSQASTDDGNSGLRNRSSIRRDPTKGSSGASSSDSKHHDSRGKIADDLAAERQTPYLSYFHEICPIEISIREGSAVLGNDATPSVLIAHFARANGIVNHIESRSPCDDGKSVYDLRFEKVKILTRTNVDYSGPLLAHGKKAYDRLLQERPETSVDKPSKLSARSGFHFIAKTFDFLRDPKFSTPPVAGLPRDRVWRGLARYREMDDEAAQHQPHREEREYAKYTTLVETTLLDLVYYADDPGPVPDASGPVLIDPADQLGNIEAAPEYGIDITIHGGTITYGPWADRQRDALQTAFAPSIFFDSEPKARLQLGDTRVHTHMILNINLAEETTLRIPTREPSKDWEYDGSDPSTEERKYGWLDVTVGPNSSVVYTQSQVATSLGYDTMLALHLDSLKIASSINLHTFVNAKSCKLSITMPTPLRWDAQRDWGFDVTLEEPDITLMRDHTTLISDLARDWSSGVQGDYHHFVPNHYNFRVTILNYGIHLFLNDFNVIDDPRSRAGNAMADFYGPRLDAYIAVATTRYRPEFSVVPFNVEAKDIRVDLALPTWDTHRGVDGSQVIEIGKIGEITAEGSYRYYAEPKPDHQETLALHLEGRRVAFKALGWALRRLFCVKDNYFGGYTSFKTMSEFFQRFEHDRRNIGDPVEEKYRPGRSDPYAVQVTMNVEDSLILMSDEIYACEKGVVMPVPKLQMSLRSQEKFMDLSLDSPPTFVVPIDDLASVYSACTVPPILDDAIFVEGIELKANRLFGPQPRAETYLCLWEAVIPRITCSLSMSFVATLQAVVSAVAYNFGDPDNAPAAIYQAVPLPDVTFFKLRLGEALVKVTDKESAVSIALAEGVNLDLSTWATRSCGSSIGILIPSVAVHILHRDVTTRGSWQSVAEAHSGASIDVYQAPKDWRRNAAAQQSFIRKEDAETRRVAYLYESGHFPRRGHFDHQVYVPTPRYPDGDFASDEGADDTDSSFASISSRPSSPEDEYNHSQEFVKPRTARESRSRRNRTKVQVDSDSEESGSVSECSSRSEPGPGDVSDISTKLAEELRKFRATDRTMHDGVDETEEDESIGVESFSASASRRGTVIKVALQPVSVTLRPVTLKACANMAVAFQEVPRRPDVLLDQLLVAHTEKLGETSNSGSSMVLDLTVPRLRARALHSEVGTSSPIIVCSVKQVSTKLSNTSQDGQSLIALAVRVKSFDTTLCAPEAGMQLQDVESNGTPGDPVARVSCEGLELGVDQRSRRTRIMIKANMFNTGIVTPAFESIRDLVTIWQSATDNLPSSSIKPKPATVVIYDAIRAAVNEGQITAQPAFLYGSNYGLHFNDNRDIRADLGWLMLTRIRHWRHVLPQPVTQPMDDLASYIIAELNKIDDWAANGDEDFVRRQTFIQIALGDDIRLDRSGEQALLDQTLHLFVNVNILNFEHQGKMLESNRIVTSSLKVASASTGLQYLVAYKGARRIKRIRAVNAVKSIDLTLQNSVFLAVEPLLALMPDPGVSETPHEANEDAQNIYLLDNQVERAEMQLLAAGLRLRGVLDKGSVNVFHKNGSGLTDRGAGISAQTTVNTMVHLVETVLSVVKERIHNSSPMSAGTIATWHSRAFGGMATQTVFQDAQFPSQLKLLLSLQHFGLDVRPQMKALHALINHVREEDLPFYQRVIEGFIPKSAKSLVPDTPTRPKPIHATVDVSLKSVDLIARAAIGLWVRWELGNTYLTGSGLKDDMAFGVRMDPQLVGAYSSLEKSRSRDSSTLRLPHIRARGTYIHRDDQGSLSGTLDLGVFTGVMQPATLNRLLDLHRDLGDDIVDLSRQYSNEASRRKNESPGIETVPTPSSKPLVLDVEVSMAGIEIGLRADKVAASIVLEASALNGFLLHNGASDSSLRWHVKAERLGISLGHLNSNSLSGGIGTSHRYRSASMVLDVEVDDIPASSNAPRQLIVRLSRAHTIMHVAALKELVDLIRSWSYDMRAMHDERAADIAQVKLDGNKFRQKMQSKAVKTETPLTSAWLAERLVTINMTGIGIAIPLDASTTIDMSTVDQRSGPAMLFSIRTMSFHNRRNQTARFKMQQMVLQFVDVFDQARPEHFVGDYHPSENRMTVPLIDSEAEISSEPGSWKVSAHCSATDFQLNLSPSIADDVYRLIHMYHRGKTHIAQLEREYRAGLAQFGQSDSTIVKDVEQPSLHSKLAAQQIFLKMSFTFNSGVVYLSHKPLDKTVKPDRLVLPSISIWVDFTGAALGIDDVQEDGLLLVNSAIHESRNEVKPSIIPFIVDLVRRIRHHPDQFEYIASPVTPSSSAAIANRGPPYQGSPTLIPFKEASTDRLKIRGTLRIDQSELKLACGGGVENLSDAFLNLTWSSGGFVASTTYEKDQNLPWSVGGSITGVTIQLRHEHSGPDKNCVEAAAKDMAFTVLHTPSPGSDGQDGLSIVFDTSVSAQFRLDAYSAWLCFMAVWVENVWKFGRPAIAPTRESSDQNPAAPPLPLKPHMVIAALIRFRSIDFDVSVPVTRAALQISPLTVRTLADGQETELEVSIGILNLHGKGDISGDVTSRHLSMHSKRQSSRNKDNSSPSVLVMSIDAGDLTGNAYIDNTKIVQFQLAPSKVTLADDWVAHKANPHDDVVLAFTIDAGKFMGVVRLQELPRLLGLFYDIIREIETQESRARIWSTPYRENKEKKDDQPSTITAALLQTARKASLTGTSSGQMRIKEVLKFRLSGIDLGMFILDNEGGANREAFYRFEIGSVSANFARSRNDLHHRLRDIEVVIEFARWTTHAGNRALLAEKKAKTIGEMIAEIIKDKEQKAFVPHATITMSSEQVPSDPVDTLEHDCSLAFDRKNASDISFSPNFWASATRAFRQLTHGLDEQQRTRARDRGALIARTNRLKQDDGHQSDETDNPTAMVFKRKTGSIKVPDLEFLGDFTKDLVRWIPNLQSNMNDKSPVVVHRFITVPLEDAMDQLLKLYEKQLPAGASENGSCDDDEN